MNNPEILYPADLERLKAAHALLTEVCQAAGALPMPRGLRLVANILDLLRRSPVALGTKDIARGVHRRPSSHVREVLARLKREGKIVKVTGGYRLATAPNGGAS